MPQSVGTAATWTVGARVAERVLAMVSMAILARALAPADFGLVAMAAAVVAVVEVFSAFGFDWALVRQPNVTRAHYDTAWTLRLIVNGMVMLVLCSLAVPIAEFYRREELVPIVLVMALSVVIGGLENSWIAEFRRNFRFDREFWLRTSGKLAGFAVAIALAVLLNSYWALVLGTLAARTATTLASYVMHPGRPRLSLEHRAEMMSFSVWLMIGNAADMVRSRFGEAYVGRMFGAPSLGVFSVAAELANLATTEIAAPVNRAVFSRYAQIEGDVAALKRGFLRVTAMIWGIGIPASAGIAATAPQLVPLLLGPQWHEAIPLVQIIAAWGALGVIGGNSAYVFWAMGRSKFVTLMFVLGLVCYAAFTFALAGALGLRGVAIAQVLAGVVTVSTTYVVLMRLLHLSLAELFGAVWRILVAAAAMGMLVWQSSVRLLEASGLPLFVQLGSLVLAGVLCYGLLTLLLWWSAGRPQGVELDVRDLVRGWLGPRGRRAGR